MDRQQIARLKKEHKALLESSCRSGYLKSVQECGCKMCSLEMHEANRIHGEILRLQTPREEKEGYSPER